MKIAGAMILLLGTLTCEPAFGSKGPMTAAAVLQRVSETYGNLKSCHITAQRSLEMSMPRWPALSKTVGASVDLVLVRPSKVRLEAKVGGRDLLTVSDGTTTWQYASHLHQYTRDQGALAAGDGSNGVSASSPDLATRMEDAIVFRYAGLAQYSQFARIEKEGKIKFEGQKRLCYIVDMQIPDQGTHKLWVDENSFLVLRHEEVTRTMNHGAQLLLHVVLEVKGADLNFQPGPATFTFTPPARAKEVATLDLPGTSPRLVGKPAPEFNLKTVDGERVNPSDLRGKVVVLDFWATSCPPCRKELPAIVQINQEYEQQGVVVLGVNTEDVSTVRHFLKKNHYDLTTLMDNRHEVSRAYAVRVIPNLFIINREGMVAAHLNGLRPESQLVAALNTAGVEPAHN